MSSSGIFPEFLSGSYRQYKNDTTAFLTWLGQEAISRCDYRPRPKTELSDLSSAQDTSTGAPSMSTPRLKGKARKIAKEAQAAETKKLEEDMKKAGSQSAVTEYRVSTRELMQQVEIVSKLEPKVSMPENIRRVLERAIDTRKHCCGWYESVDETAAFDNGGHRFFIGVLEDALRKLGTRKHTEYRPRTSPSIMDTSTRYGGISTKNVFSPLEVETTDDSFETTSVATSVTVKKSSKEDKKAEVFVLETDQEFDVAFQIYCFFEDIHRIHKHVVQLWRDGLTSRTPLTLIYATTQSAITLIRRSEQELCDTALPDFEGKHTYDGLCDKLLNMNDSEEEFHRHGMHNTSFVEFLFLHVASILRSFKSEAALSNRGLSMWPYRIKPLKQHFPNEPRHLLYLLQPEEQEEDEIFLIQLLLDLQLPDHLDRRTSDSRIERFDPIQKDILYDTLRPVWMEGKLSVTAVVMADLMVHIHRICKGDLRSIYEHLQQMNNHTVLPKDWDEIYQTEELGSLVSTVWPGSSGAECTTLLSVVKGINKPPHPLLKKDFQETHPCRKYWGWSNDILDSLPEYPRTILPIEMVHAYFGDGIFIHPAPEHDFVLLNNPLYSCSAELKLLSLYHKAGITAANDTLVVLTMAHCYNALRQLNLLDTAWPVMDRIIELHKKSIFADSIPVTTSDIAHRVSYRIEGMFKNKLKKRYALNEPHVAGILELMLSDDISDHGRALYQMEQLLVQQNKTAETGDIRPNSGEVPAAEQRISPENFLSDMQQLFSAILDDLSIDYLSLVKRCSVKLAEFRDQVAEYTEMRDAEQYLRTIERAPVSGDDGIVFTRIFVVQEALKQAKTVRDSGFYSYRAGDGDTRAKRGSANTDLDDPLRHGRGLWIASKIMKEFITNENVDFKVPLKWPKETVLEAERVSQQDAGL